MLSTVRDGVVHTLPPPTLKPINYLRRSEMWHLYMRPAGAELSEGRATYTGCTNQPLPYQARLPGPVRRTGHVCLECFRQNVLIITGFSPGGRASMRTGPEAFSEAKRGSLLSSCNGFGGLTVLC